ncbi:MAG: sensor histidine kinase N-terminal domain-containing protein, partial [Moraxellaceae bacterium]|nr:sensor histidine kinase N-terminal domain-containing protein [Moraxellaceae bacterium]
MKSIRQYLLLGMFVTLLLAFMVSLLISYRAINYEIAEVYDAQLVQDARFIEGFLNQKSYKIDWSHISQALAHINQLSFNQGEEANADGHSYERKMAIQVWDNQGNLLLTTPNAPQHALSPLKKGFFRQQHSNHDWYIYSHQIPNNKYWLLVAEHADIRNEITEKMLSSLLIGSLMSLLLIAVLISWIIKNGLAPLNQLSKAMQARDLDYLQPVQLSQTPPHELKPVLQALNHLLQRLDEGLERERRFLADAAHELRTPLAVLKLQLQVAQQAPTLNEMRQGVDNALLGVNRSTHTVEQLLTLARIEANKQTLQRESIDMVALAQEVVANLFPLALDKQQDIELLYTQETVLYTGNRLLLSILLRNLLSNAIYYSPMHAQISVKVEAL